MTAQKKTHPDLAQEDEARVQQLLERRQEMAQALHTCTSRAQAEEVLAEAFTANEETQLALLKRLTALHDSDAADLLLALHELAPGKAVRKEARRALIQLAGAKVYPSWTPEPEAAVAGNLPGEMPPRFWKGSVAETRETGEVQLTLCWEQGVEYAEARMISFLLDFWHEGVKDFYTDAGSKRQIEEHLKELRQIPIEVGAREVECTLAEGRRLLNESLDVNRWRKKEPNKDFRQHLPLVQRLVLNATNVGEDRGASFIDHDIEPDVVAGSFAGAWSMGDYGLCYDLLTRESPVREGRARDEWISMRRAWADEAHAVRFEMYFLREREAASKQSSLWLPSNVLSTRAPAGKEVELGWSLELTETQLSGTLPEMPMGTAVHKETGRSWFWTVFSLEQEAGNWRIARLKDEGAAIQALPVEELQKRIKEYDDAIQTIMREHGPTDPDAEKYFDEVIWRSWQILSFDDAILVHTPLDKETWEDGYGRAMSMRAVERAALYAEGLVKRFPDDPDSMLMKQRLGMAQIAVGERFSSLGLQDQASHFRDQGEAVLRGTLSTNDPLGYLLIAELLISKQQFDEAEQLLLEAREVAHEGSVEARAQIEFDLANLAINRDRFAEAQGYLERVAVLAPNQPGLWATLGYAQRNQKNYAEATISYKRAIEEEPTDMRAYAELGTLYLDERNLDQARDVLNQGIRTIPNSAHLRALMSLVYLEQGDTRRAREYLDEAERINPNLETIPVLREALKKK